MFNLRQLKAFVTVVDYKSFTRAAKTLYMTQPAISAQVKALEERLDVQLMERNDKNVVLTEEGQIFYDEAKKIISIFDGFIDTIDEIKGIRRGKLCIGASTIPGEYIIPRMLGDFARKYPGLQLSIKISDTGYVVEQLLKRSVDLGFIGAPIKNEMIELEEFVNDELVIIAPPTDNNEGRILTAPELIEHKFILREAESGTRMVFYDQLRKLKCNPEDINVAMELGSTRAVISAVESGLGISVVSKYAAEDALKLGKVSQIHIENMSMVRALYLAWNKYKYQSQPIKAFLEFARSSSAFL